MPGKDSLQKKARPMILIVIAVLLALTGYYLQNRQETALKISPADAIPAGIPKLIDLGRDSCTACKAMRPILEELQKEYAGRVGVAIINIDDFPEEAEKYGIYLIPTQIFFDAAGKIVYRHEGFMPKEEIEVVFRNMGIK
ncbi:MAG: thioredoxin family protein [Firmicutes bacterium]|nr:thioredoxin family protein [Bacillota bacterium]